jgi:hypothetical protein
MEETVGPVSACGRELLRGWWRLIGFMVIFMIFTASVWNILDRLSYVYIAEDWIPSWGIPDGIYDGRIGNRASFSPKTSVSPSRCQSTIHSHSSALDTL